MKQSVISIFLIILLVAFIVIVLITGMMKTDVSSVCQLFLNVEFLDAVFFSLKTSFIATVMAFFIGVPSGFFLARNKGCISGIIDTIFDIPVVVPPLVVGVLLLTFFNYPLMKEIYPMVFTLSGAVIAQFFVAVPLTVKSAKTAFELVPEKYEMIAMTLGSKPFKSFYDTTFKIALPGIVSGVILTWLRCMGEFGATLMVGGGIPFETENIPINIYLNMAGGDIKSGIAASVVSIIIAFISVILVKIILNLKYRRNA